MDRKTQKLANEMASMKMIDPLHYYRDMGLDNPEGRTEDLMMFMSDPASYMAKVKGLGGSTPELINTLMGGNAAMQSTSSGSITPTQAVTPALATQQQPLQVPSPENTGATPPTPIGPPQGSPRVL